MERPEYTGCTVNFKTYSKSHKLKKRLQNTPENYRIFPNTQSAIIEEKVFERVQGLRANKRRPTKTGRQGLFSGLLYCADCGSFMRPKLSQRRNKDGELIYDYLCELKEKSKGQKCDIKRALGNEADRLVCEEIKKLTADESEFMKMLKKEQKCLNINDSSCPDNLKKLRKSESDTEAKIKNLLQTLARTENSSAQDYILNEINELDKKIKSFEAQIKEYEDLANTGNISDTEFESLADMLCSFADSFETMNIEQKRLAIRAFIKRIVWDGERIHIYFFGCEEGEIDLSDDEFSEPQRKGCK